MGIHVPKMQISMQSKTQIQARTHTDRATQKMHRSMPAHRQTQRDRHRHIHTRFVHIHRDRHTDTDTEIHTDTRTQRDRHRHTGCLGV